MICSCAKCNITVPTDRPPTTNNQASTAIPFAQIPLGDASEDSVQHLGPFIDITTSATSSSDTHGSMHAHASIVAHTTTGQTRRRVPIPDASKGGQNKQTAETCKENEAKKKDDKEKAQGVPRTRKRCKTPDPNFKGHDNTTDDVTPRKIKRRKADTDFKLVPPHHVIVRDADKRMRTAYIVQVDTTTKARKYITGCSKAQHRAYTSLCEQCVELIKDGVITTKSEAAAWMTREREERDDDDNDGDDEAPDPEQDREQDEGPQGDERDLG